MADVPDGSIYDYETKAGRRWGFVIDAPAGEGRRQIRRQGFRLERDAKGQRDALRALLAGGRVPKPDDGTTSGYAAGWIETLPAEGIELSTVRHYAEGVNRLMPTIGDIPLQQLTTDDLDRAYAALRAAGRSARTIRASHVAIRKMLTRAYERGVVAGNVSGKANAPRPRATRPKRFPTWDQKQLGVFLAAIAADPDYALWYLAARTGMRRGELVAVRWEDVDLNESVIAVVRASTIDRKRQVSEKLPKSDAGRRQVEIEPADVAVLREHRRRQLEVRLALGAGWRSHDLVFPALDGSQLHPDTASSRWRTLAKRVAPGAGLPIIRMHDLRHSHATQLLAAGARPEAVTQRLGHSSVAFTLQTYGHVRPGDQRSALALLSADQTEAVTSAGMSHRTVP